MTPDDVITHVLTIESDYPAVGYRGVCSCGQWRSERKSSMHAATVAWRRGHMGEGS